MLTLWAAGVFAAPVDPPEKVLAPQLSDENIDDMVAAIKIWQNAIAEEPIVHAHFKQYMRQLVSMTNYSISSNISSLYPLAEEQESDVLYTASEGLPLMEAYRLAIKAKQGDQAHVPPKDVPGYDMCAMCKAMYVHGKCSSADKAESELKEYLSPHFNSLASNVTRLDYLLGSTPTDPQFPHFTPDVLKAKYRLKNIHGTARMLDQDLKCEDDSDIWWKTCSNVPCMNNMEGIDSSCKYRIASPDFNPLGGSIENGHTMLEKGIGVVAKQGSKTALASLVAFELGMNTFSVTYYHAHCGAGFDLRSVNAACHFPKKRWCTQMGAQAHYRECASMFCTSCLWNCRTALEQSLPPDYGSYPVHKPIASSLLDTVIPQECMQDEWTQLSEPTFRQMCCNDPNKAMESS